ncbi:MAG: hypothetical protein KKB20_09520 [Proteobacteria bacterium]|nr:hypothetical protein [Pseudomonadota bacterium]
MLNVTSMSRPIDWAGLFGRQAPLEVEIGYGNGDYLVRRAKQLPERDFIGLELTWASTKRALRRLAKVSAGNVRLARVDARMAFGRLFRPRTLTRVYSLYPLPWPKDRHARRRLFCTDFLRLVCSRLEDHGQALIVTDHEPLSDWILGQTPGSGFEAERGMIPARFQTKYERKWQDNGQAVFHEISLLKTAHPDVPLEEDADVLTLHLGDFNPDRFDFQGQTGPITVIFKEFLYDPRRRKALVRVLVDEDGLLQHVWIQIEDQGKAWAIGMARESHVLPTAGVKRAVELVYRAAGGD